MKYIISESQVKHIIKKFFKKDFSEKIQMIQNWDDLSYKFKKVFGLKRRFNNYLNMFGPMYIILVDGIEYLTQNRKQGWDIVDDNNNSISEDELMNLLGISTLGISMNEFIDAYVNY